MYIYCTVHLRHYMDSFKLNGFAVELFLMKCYPLVLLNFKQLQWLALVVYQQDLRNNNTLTFGMAEISSKMSSEKIVS